MNKKGDSAQKNQHIQVFARCRPLNQSEKMQGSPSIVEVVPEKKAVLVKDRKDRREFLFDKVFATDTSQITVYKSVVEPLIQEVLMGYNCTVLAYGQTGTGKTYTMEGKRSNSKCTWEDDPGAGIVPRSLHQLFEELNKGENVEFSVRVSFLELYNEELFDLLGASDFSDRTRLRLFEDPAKKGSVIIQGLEEIPVHSKDEVYAILERGTARRQTAATLYNDASSRSHTVFSVTVHIKENTVEGEELLKTGKLNLVDLAGSENVGRSGAINQRLREAGNINQSLLTLGRVFTSLIEKQPHVPYRESKLTRILQDSLGGHTKTSIIATISPAQMNLDETLSTLDYATKAKSITIKPEANQRMTKRALIREYTDEIERLKKDLFALRNGQGFYIDNDNYQNMLKEIEKNKEIREEIATKEQEMLTMQKEIDKMKELFEETSLKLNQTSQVLTQTQQALSKTALERDETEHLLNAHCSTERKLTEQAKTLLQVTHQTTNDVDKLQAKLDRKREVERTNEERSDSFKVMYQKQFAHLDDVVSQMKTHQLETLCGIGKTLDQVSADISNFKVRCSKVLLSVFDHQKNELGNLSSCLKEETEHRSELAHSSLANLNSRQDALYSKQQPFLEETFPHLVSQLSDLLVEVEDLVSKKQMCAQKQIDELITVIRSNTEIKRHLIGKVQNALDDFHVRHESLKTELEETQKHLCSFQEEYEKCRDEEIEQLYAYISQFKHNSQKTKLKIEETQSKMANLINVESNLKLNQEPLNELDVFENSIDLLTPLNTLSNTCEMNQIITKQNSAKSTTATLSSLVIDFLSENQKEQQEIIAEVNEGITDVISKDQAKCEGNKLKLEENISSLSKTVESENTTFEKQFNHLTNKVVQVENKVTQSKEHIGQFADLLKKEILQRDLEFEKFISEDLLKDIPTGTTPQRRNYEFPKKLAHTSPDERLLQRLRGLRNNADIAMNLPLETSFNESDEFKSPTGLEATQSTIVPTSSTDEEDCLSSASSMSDLSIDSQKNKENWKKPSHVPKLKKPKKQTKSSESTRSSSNERRPLVFKNTTAV